MKHSICANDILELSQGKIREETSLKHLTFDNDSLEQGAVTMAAYPYMVDSRAEGTTKLQLSSTGKKTKRVFCSVLLSEFLEV